MQKKIWILVLFVSSILFAGCNEDKNNNPITANQTPTISGINPTSFARGSDHVDLNISGTNLTGATTVFLGDGIGVHKVTVSNANKVVAQISIQRKAVLGTRTVTVVTPKGTANGAGLLTIAGDRPVAKFTISPAGDISQNTQVEFDASSSFDVDGSIQAYAWDFGDGKRAQGKVVNHTFVKGKYNLKLTVKDNDGQSSSETKALDVKEVNEVKCTVPSKNNGFIGGTVVGVEGKYAIVQFAKDRTCANTFYMCGDMRLDEPEIFRGIIHEMYFLGDGKFKILNDCPYRWPPQIGEYDVIHFKTCASNFCP